MTVRTSSVNLLDYGAIGNGINGALRDTQAFLDAFDDIYGGSNSGCTLYVPPGLYMLTRPIPIFASLTIQGVYDQSIIQAIPGLNDWMFYFVPYGMGPIISVANSRNGMGRVNLATQVLHNGKGRVGVYTLPLTGIPCIFRDITLNNDAINQTAGGCVNAIGAVRSIFEHVHFKNPYDAGLWFGPIVSSGNGYGNHVNRCVFDGGNVSGGNGQGLRLTGSDKNTIVYNSFENNGGAGTETYHVKDSSNYNLFDGNTFSTGHEGIRLDGTIGSRVLANTFDNVGRACVHSSGASGTISNNVMLDGATDATNTYSHIEIEGANNKIIGNYQRNSVAGQVKAFYEEISSAANANIVFGNTYDEIALTGFGNEIIRLGAATVISQNQGFNPRGALGAGLVPVSVSGAFFLNDTGFDCFVVVQPGTGTITQLFVGGVDTGVIGGGFYIPVGQTIRVIYTGTISWTWFAN